jgi:periplasmic protein TonB
MMRKAPPTTSTASGETSPPRSPPPTGPTPPATPEPPSAITGWDELLSAWLEAHKSYPEVARRQGQEGTVTLRFTVAADGSVLDVAVVTGSGSQVLDNAAQQMLHGARLPAPRTELSRVVRIRYRLEN